MDSLRTFSELRYRAGARTLLAALVIAASGCKSKSTSNGAAETKSAPETKSALETKPAPVIKSASELTAPLILRPGIHYVPDPDSMADDGDFEGSVGDHHPKITLTGARGGKFEQICEGGQSNGAYGEFAWTDDPERVAAPVLAYGEMFWAGSSSEMFISREGEALVVTSVVSDEDSGGDAEFDGRKVLCTIPLPAGAKITTKLEAKSGEK